jgi:hypothetical protein
MRAILIPAIVCTWLLAACAHAPAPRAPAADSPAAPSWPLVAPDAIAPRAASQVIRGTWGGKSMTLRTAIELDADSLDVVAVTATGQRVFTIHSDGKTVRAERGPFVPKAVEPERVLVDMQLALWPLASIEPQFRAAGYSVVEPFAGVRRVLRGEKLVAEVHYTGADPWAGRLWLVNFEHDYSLTIDTGLTADAGAP